MIYLYENLANYSNEAYLKHLKSLPVWRREKALQYKKLDDRKRSVLAFVLLQRALRDEYGITEVPEFVYNEFGKPSLPNLPIHFSLSHCKDAVACAVSDHNIGLDVESIVPYNPDVARRACTADELKMLEQSSNTGCNMKPLRKAWIEDIVIDEVSKALHDDRLIDDIVHMFMEFHQKENTVIPHLEHELAETKKAINNMLNAIEQGIITPMTKKRLDALEEKHRNIETDIVKEKMKHPLLTKEQVRFWFERMREYDITVLEQRKRLIDTFVNAIFVYNDRLLFTFNYKHDAKTVLFSDLKSSDITKGVRSQGRQDGHLHLRYRHPHRRKIRI